MGFYNNCKFDFNEITFANWCVALVKVCAMLAWLGLAIVVVAIRFFSENEVGKSSGGGLLYGLMDALDDFVFWSGRGSVRYDLATWFSVLAWMYSILFWWAFAFLYGLFSGVKTAPSEEVEMEAPDDARKFNERETHGYGSDRPFSHHEERGAFRPSSSSSPPSPSQGQMPSGSSTSSSASSSSPQNADRQKTTITHAVVQGTTCYVYRSDGTSTFISMSGKNDKLLGWTSETVTIQRNNVIYTYNGNGTSISARTTW